MATLKDIARNVGLSVMAVSKALRDAPDISAATKARVRAEADRLKYVPNQAARNLRSRQSFLLGAVVPQINHPYFSNVVWGIERHADSQGYQVLLSHSLDSADLELDVVRKLLARQVDGLMLVPAVRWQNRLATLELAASANVPVVLLDRYPAGADQFERVSWIVTADGPGMEAVVDHLIQQGHRDILFLAGPHGSSSSAARMEGYRRAMTRAGCYDPARVFLAGHGLEGGRKGMLQALSEGVSFTAVAGFNDSVAFGAIEVLLGQGLSVPGDVSVTGFNDSLLAAYFRVPLTTVRVPIIEMGTAAMVMMSEFIAGNRPQPRELSVELVVRDSTASPAK